MKISIPQKLVLFSFIILASNGLIGYAVYKSNQSHLDAEKQVEHTEQVIYQLASISSLIKDVIIASRSYVITNDSTYLDQLYNTQKSIFLNIKELRQLTQSDPSQQRRIDSLSFYIHKSLDFSLQTIELRSKQGFKSAIANISTRNGRLYSYHLLQIINSIQQEAIVMLKQRKLADDRIVAELEWFTTVMFILMAAFSFLLLVTNHKNLLQRKEKEKRAAELIIANKELVSQSEHSAHLAAIVESSENAIISRSLDGKIKSWNKGAENIFGFTAEEVIGKETPLIVPPDDVKNINRILERVSQNETIGAYETIRMKKNGELFNASLSLSPMKDKTGKIIGISVLTHDITTRKKAEQEIIQKTEELVRANKELAFQNEEKKKREAELITANNDLTAFTYVSSHDLQEPLRKIQVFATLLLEQEEKNLSDNGKVYFKKMQATANRMQTLLEDLLAYSRTKTAEPNFVKTDLNLILEEVENNFEEIIIEKNATIMSINLSPVNIIPFQFRQLIHNLIGNSLKFSNPKMSPIITITGNIEKGSSLNIEKLSSEINYCHLTFADNGIGFDPQYQTRIFEVFQRLHSYEEFKGTGIGLAICKRIVENHKGIITATGELNKGARFDIYIPA